jgi:hypothetical protein
MIGGAWGGEGKIVWMVIANKYGVKKYRAVIFPW